MAVVVDTDYCVVGAGAMGMAFADAVVEHSARSVVLVDRRTAPGGHWRDAYPFVRLHQASAFYGVASTLLGAGRTQQAGPEMGLHERATMPQICAYYDQVLDRLIATGRVDFLGGHDYVDRRLIAPDGSETRLAPHCRVVDAHFLEPEIPATTPPPFAVDDDAVVVPVGALPGLTERPSRYVVVGSGKTATDACVWLLSQGVDPDATCWVRPRDPWMLNRAVVQPDPAVFLGMAADVMTAAAAAASLDDLFRRLEDAGVVVRLDREVTPTMAKTPTLARWELDQLRSVQDVVRRGHIRRVERGRLVLDRGAVSVSRHAVVVHCAASGLRMPEPRPVWTDEAITLQPVRAGFPCFGAALIGYVEATRHDDAEKNRLCAPTPYSNTPREWAAMNLRGTRATQTFNAEPDIKAWANAVSLNPARVSPDRAAEPAVSDALARLAETMDAGLAGLARLSDRT